MRALLLVVMLAALAGCDPFARFRPVRVPPLSPEVALDDDDRLAWAETEPWAVVVRRRCRALDVYQHGNRVRSYPAVFGLASAGNKLYEGDLRTPTGLYMIVDKRPHARWGWFMLLDYPNTRDRERYWEALSAGDLPFGNGGFAGIGGQVGIHGSDKPALNARNVDWTLGCISLKNSDVSDLAGLVPVGTLVLIED